MLWLRGALLCVMAAGICALVFGCSSNCNACAEDSDATLELSCGPSNLTAVQLTGPCPSVGDGGIDEYVNGNMQRFVSFGATSPGTCHVTLVFATGFTYAADVTFASTNPGCPGCASVLTPTTPVIMVNNPSNTCVLDSGVQSDADADSGAVDATSN